MPSYCEAAKERPEDVRAAVGAGLSEALAEQEAKDEYEIAKQILVNACTPACDETVLAAFAASQATTVQRLCDYSGAGRNGTGVGAGPGTGVGGGGQTASGS